jgi:hypothetical protein
MGGSLHGLVSTAYRLRDHRVGYGVLTLARSLVKATALRAAG